MNKKQSIATLAILALLLNGCTSPNYITQLNDIIREWGDAIKIASTTSRIALSQPVAKLQEIKRKAEKIKIPQQRGECYSHLLKYMDLSIDLFLSFMQTKESSAEFFTQLSYNELDKWELCLTKKETKLLMIPEKEERFIRKTIMQRMQREDELYKEKQSKEAKEKARLAEQFTDRFGEGELKMIFYEICSAYYYAEKISRTQYSTLDRATQEKNENKFIQQRYKELEERYKINSEELKIITKIGDDKGWKSDWKKWMSATYKW